MPYLAKDFIETAEGLLFAVVAHGTEQGKVLCFLRYAIHQQQFEKYDTLTANQLLQARYQDYLYYSPKLQARLHAVALEKIVKHHQPKQRLADILHAKPKNKVLEDVQNLCQLLAAEGVNLQQCGVTGSVLIGAERDSSDIDLVCYEQEVFRHCRFVVRDLIARQQLHDLTLEDWQVSYQRRCCELSFDDYVWHEQRKFNKGMINGRKFDLSLLNQHGDNSQQYQKCGALTIQAQVIDDCGAFFYPAEFKVNHPDIDAVVSFTATYVGQAGIGEVIEATGQVEQDQQGVKRLVIGSSREAVGEYIKVLQ